MPNNTWSNIVLFIVSVAVFLFAWLYTGNALIAALAEVSQLMIYGLIAGYRGGRNDNQRS